MWRQLTLLLVGAVAVMAQRRLALPDPRSCANSKCAISTNISSFKRKITVDYKCIGTKIFKKKQSRKSCRCSV